MITSYVHLPRGVTFPVVASKLAHMTYAIASYEEILLVRLCQKCMHPVMHGGDFSAQQCMPMLVLCHAPQTPHYSGHHDE